MSKFSGNKNLLNHFDFGLLRTILHDGHTNEVVVAVDYDYIANKHAYNVIIKVLG